MSRNPYRYKVQSVAILLVVILGGAFLLGWLVGDEEMAELVILPLMAIGFAVLAFVMRRDRPAVALFIATGPILMFFLGFTGVLIPFLVHMESEARVPFQAFFGGIALFALLLLYPCVRYLVYHFTHQRE